MLRPLQQGSKEVLVPDQSWRMHIDFTEQEGHTRADAVLELASAKFHGFGQARRAPSDPSVPVVGQDLAAARALSDLAHQLLNSAAERIETWEGHPVTTHL